MKPWISLAEALLFPEIFLYPLVGMVAGLLAGLMGVGGGLVIVPALAIILPVTTQIPADAVMHVAIGTSLASIILTSVASSYAHHSHHAVRWTLMVSMAPGLVFGALLGAVLADQLRSNTLRTIFALFLLTVAVYMAINLRVDPHRELPATAGLNAAGGMIGFISAVVGIGGGTMTVPYLIWNNVSLHQAVGTSAACGLPIAIAGAAGFILSGQEAGLSSASGYVYWPAFAGVAITSTIISPVGAALAHRLPIAILKRAFAALLVLVAVQMLIAAKT